jgi:primosomal protein N' (replication factor Y) (superfamily II helicase)
VLYAKIVLNLPVAGPFDYSLDEESAKLAAPGMRAWVNFCGRKLVGYIAGISSESNIPRVKPVIRLIDTVSVITPEMLKLTRMLADYYCCSWGEAIAVSLPEPLRKGKAAEGLLRPKGPVDKGNSSGLLLGEPDTGQRWEIYAREISGALSAGRSALVLITDKSIVLKAQAILKEKIGLEAFAFYRQQPNELKEWTMAYNGEIKLVFGTRSSVFAPLANLGLIIVDEENDPAFKQDQTPHYHARQVALMRSKLENARIILGGTAVSLEAHYLSRKNGFELREAARKEKSPEIKIVDMKSLPLLDKKKNIILSRLLQDAMVSVLADKGKILLFLNRKGFATAATCSTCRKSLKCPRCNSNLVYFFNQEMLLCRYCNFKLPPPKICPECKSGYIKFSGAGTEKIESELSRIFPQARVKTIDSGEITGKTEADIFISTQGILRQPPFRFDLCAALAIDNSLNQVDFRSTERVFAILLALRAITEKKMFVQTSIPGHYCFRSIENNDAGIFYEEELRSRRQVKFPPYSNFCQVKLRGRVENKVKEAGEKLFHKFSEAAVPKGIKIISLNPGSPPKLRGNFYWVILISAMNMRGLNSFIKINLKDFRSSGIIVTVDVDPV